MINQPWRLATNGSAIVCGEGEDRQIVAACPSAALFLEAESGTWIDRAEHIIKLHNEWLMWNEIHPDKKAQKKSNRRIPRERFRRKVIDRIRKSGEMTPQELASFGMIRAFRDLQHMGVVTIIGSGSDPAYRCTIDEEKAARI